MIIKRTLKFEMPNLKRCKLEEPDGEDYAYSTKKRRTNGYHSFSNGKLEDFSSGSGSLLSDESNLAVEVESNLTRSSGRRALNPNSESFRRSSRGRVQMLPSRYNDSVHTIWNNESKFDETETAFDDYDVEEEDIERLGFVRKNKKESYMFKNSKSVWHNEKEKHGEVGSIGLGMKFDRSSTGSEGYASGFGFSGGEKLRKAATGKRKEIYKPGDFTLGDIVWAKCGRSYPAWPAVVIDPLSQAPEAVLKCCVPNAICVMFYGYSKNGKQRDYGWVKQGMVFPFLEFLDRFRGQTQLYKSKPSEFQMAIEEALLVDNGVLDASMVASQITKPEAHSYEIQYDQYYSQNKEVYNKDTKPCDECGLLMACKLTKRMKGSSCETQHLCKHCAKLKKSKQYCGVCKKIWHHSDEGNWNNDDEQTRFSAKLHPMSSSKF